MHRRAVRITLLTIMLAGGLASGLFLYDIERRTSALRDADAEVSARVVRLTGALMDAAAAQHAYVTPGQAGAPWFERMTTLVRQLYDDTAALGGRVRSPEAQAAVAAVTAGIEAFVAADLRVRENLRVGQPLMAADVIFSDSRNTVDTIAARLRELRETETRAAGAEQAVLVRQRWLALGGLALLWILGAVLLVPVRSAKAEGDTLSLAVEPAEAPAVPEAPSVDLAAAASLCVDLSRVTSAAALPALLARAAALVDAPGVILWMAAGEELFAVTAHGYPEQVMKKVRPIARRAENATAAAWRDGRTVTVAGVANGNGAIVAPLFGPDACIGVLAAELRHGREQDPTAQAVVTMIAAQLATVVSAWPAASSGEVRAEASA